MELTNKCFGRCFNTLKEGEPELLNSFFRSFDYQGASYSFLANFIWRTDYAVGWDVVNGYLMIGRVYEDEEGRQGVISMPLTRTGSYDPVSLRDAINEMRCRMRAVGAAMDLVGVSGHMLPILEEAFGGKVDARHERDLDEYVYEKQKLITLSGRALHKKKNHLNYFLKTYTYEARPLTRDDLEDILRLTDTVRAEHDRTEEQLLSLAQEKRAIRMMIDFIGDPGIYTVGVFIDGEMQAYAIGEMLSEDTAVEHFEKANLKYRGLYQAVCSEFCKALPDTCLYVNREEDMGLENLRHAKQALRPHHMAEKYICTLTDQVELEGICAGEGERAGELAAC